MGRTLALLLARERLRVALVCTPSPDTTVTSAPEDVRAYALNAASRQLLESLRAWPDTAHATPVLGMQVQGDAKGASQGVVNFSAAAQGVAALAWIVDVPALEAQLAQAVKFQPLIEVITSTPEAPNSTVSTYSHIENLGIRADLTVICEGKNSVTRQQLAVEFDVTPYHQHAIAARLTGDLPHGGIARQWFTGAETQGEILAFLPLSDHSEATSASNSAADGNSVALVWSVSTERAKHLMGLSAEDFADAVAQASGLALGEMQLYSARATWPLQLARANHWVGVDAVLGPWALAGDAAHTVHPLSGQGLNLGLADVAELAKVLGKREKSDYWRSVGDMKLLRRYERARKLDVLTLGTVTDGLQRLFARGSEAEKTPWQLLRNLGMQGFERSGGLKHWVTKRAMGL